MRGGKSREMETTYEPAEEQLPFHADAADGKVPMQHDATGAFHPYTGRPID